MVLLQNEYKNTLVGVLRTQITFVTHFNITFVLRYTAHLGDQALFKLRLFGSSENRLGCFYYFITWVSLYRLCHPTSVSCKYALP